MDDSASTFFAVFNVIFFLAALGVFGYSLHLLRSARRVRIQAIALYELAYKDQREAEELLAESKDILDTVKDQDWYKETK